MDSIRQSNVQNALWQTEERDNALINLLIIDHNEIAEYVSSRHLQGIGGWKHFYVYILIQKNQPFFFVNNANIKIYAKLWHEIQEMDEIQDRQRDNLKRVGRV
jgi:hypothetical protein